jgi:8-oxo-dGTP diphosphatase
MRFEISSLVADGHRAAVVVNRDIDDFGFGDAHALAWIFHAVGFHYDFDCDRSAANSRNLCIKTNKVADKHRRDKNDFVHGFRDDFLQRMFAHFNRSGDVNVAQNYASEDRAMRVRVFRHQHDADGRLRASLVIFKTGFRFVHTLNSLIQEKAKVKSQKANEATRNSTLPFYFQSATFRAMRKTDEMNDEQSETDEMAAVEIIAAGGIVVDRNSAGAASVLLAHRPRYDDWSFPKGKLDPGETIEEAALREVKEETGLDCRIVDALQTLRYSYRDRRGRLRPKAVYYFLMEPVSGEIAVNIHEIDDVQWFRLSAALEKLSYARDKEFLAAVFGSELSDQA